MRAGVPHAPDLERGCDCAFCDCHHGDRRHVRRRVWSARASTAVPGGGTPCRDLADGTRDDFADQLSGFADVSAGVSFDAGTALTGGRGSLRVGDTIHRINGISFEPAGFAMVGATPHLGRLLTQPMLTRRTQ